MAGNGGGAPVVVSGWTCQGYNTPEVLSTGNASQCHTGGAAILAVLPVSDPYGQAEPVIRTHGSRPGGGTALGTSEACPAATAPLIPREVLLTALRPLVVLIIWT